MSTEEERMLAEMEALKAKIDAKDNKVEEKTVEEPEPPKPPKPPAPKLPPKKTTKKSTKKPVKPPAKKTSPKKTTKKPKTIPKKIIPKPIVTPPPTKVKGKGEKLGKFPNVPARLRVIRHKHVCYNCRLEKDEVCNLYGCHVSPDEHCMNYRKGVRVIGRFGH